MGYDLHSVKISYAIRNNSPTEQDLEESLADELFHRIELICSEHQYQSIDPMVLR